MSEFDLIHTAAPEPGASVPYRYQTLVGDAGLSVLSVTVNPLDGPLPWPTIEELPGLRALAPADGSSPFTVKEDGDVTSLSWNGHDLLQSLQPPRLFPVDFEGLPGLKHRPEEKLPENFRNAVRWDWKLQDDQRFYGLGERSLPLERRGTAPTNWTTDEPSGHHRSTDPLYQAHPLLWGVTGDTWWAVFYLHSPYSRFDLGQDRHDRMRWLSLGDSVTFQLHAASSPTELHRSLRQVWEAPTAPPLWSFGFHQSRWGYRSGHEVTELVDEFLAKDLPIDVVHLDIDYMEEYRSFTFSKERFPNPKAMLDGLRDKGVRTVTIIDPGLRFDPGTGYTALDEGLAGNHFLKSVSGAPVVAYCWPDEALFPDYSRAAAREWWARHCRFYLQNSVAGLWIDMNEPATFDRPFWTGAVKQLPMPLNTPGGEEGRRFTQAALHNLYGAQMSQATHDTWAADGERPWVLTRSGFTGVGRYAWSWMGDNTSWWEHLQMSFPQLASMGLVGSPFVGVDVGGFFGHCTGDLYSAWIEASVVYPMMRAHSALGTRIAHPWSFGPEVEEVARTAIRFRYRLLPYLYATAMAQAEGDVPFLRPMFFDYPQDQRFDLTEDQVMVGPDLMAAPFLGRGQSQRLVQLPQGIWYDLHSGTRHEGGGSIVVTRRPGLTPLFQKAGSAVPLLARDVKNTDEMKDAEWVLHVAPGDGHSSLYWDGGNGWEFQQGQCARARVEVQGESARLVDVSGEMALPTIRLALPRAEGWKVGEAL